MSVGEIIQKVEAVKERVAKTPYDEVVANLDGFTATGSDEVRAGVEAQLKTLEDQWPNITFLSGVPEGESHVFSSIVDVPNRATNETAEAALGHLGQMAAKGHETRGHVDAMRAKYTEALGHLAAFNEAMDGAEAARLAALQTIWDGQGEQAASIQSMTGYQRAIGGVPA